MTHLQRAVEIVEHLIDNSISSAGDHITITENGHQKSLRAILYETRQRMDQIAGIPELAGLQMTILKDTFYRMYPLFLTSVFDLVEQKEDPVRDVKELLQLFASDEASEIWEKRSDMYRSLCARLGLYVDKDAWKRKLSDILYPLLDAVSIWKNPNVLRISEGVQGTGEFRMLNTISVFRGESEILESAGKIPLSRCMYFAATHLFGADYIDPFKNWIFGRPDEMQCNYMKFSHMTEEEYRDMEILPSRRIYFVVKDGENLYLMEQRGNPDGYGIRSDEDKYYYGVRKTYAPFEVFYKETSPGTADVTLPNLFGTPVNLSDLMDSDSMIWLPVFLYGAVSYFKRPGLHGTPAVIASRIVPMTKEKKLFSLDTPVYLLPVIGSEKPFSNLPSARKERRACENGPLLRDLAVFLGLSDEDFSHLLPDRCFPSSKGLISRSDLPHELDGFEDLYKKAVLCLMAERAALYLKDHWTDTKQFLNDRVLALLQNEEGYQDQIIDWMVNHPKASYIVNTNRGSIVEISPEESHIYMRSLKTHLRYMPPSVLLSLEPDMKTPGILFSLHPGTPEDFAYLTRTEKSDLPELLQRFSQFQRLTQLFEKHCGNIHGINYEYDNLHELGKSIYTKSILPLCAAFSKRYFRNRYKDKVIQWKDNP